jgi:uracil-DNA glycosylase
MVISEQWDKILKNEFVSTYFKNIGTHLYKERERGCKIEPANKDYFKALKLTEWKNVKVVIIDKEPHIAGQSDGLAISCNEETLAVPLTTVNILNAIEESVYNGFKLQDWDLTRWAEQGILLLNKSLSVEKNKSGSHAFIGWDKFIQAILLSLEAKNETVIYVLLGKEVGNLKQFIKSDKALIIEIEHPTITLYENRKWVYNDCFNQINKILKETNQKEIKW